MTVPNPRRQPVLVVDSSDSESETESETDSEAESETETIPEQEKEYIDLSNIAEGCRTMDEVIEELRYQLESMMKLKKEGYELVKPILDNEGFAVKPIVISAQDD